MTILQVIDKLNKEKQEGIPSRFPCRAIMVKMCSNTASFFLNFKKFLTS